MTWDPSPSGKRVRNRWSGEMESDPGFWLLSKRGYPSPEVPTVAPGPTSGKVRIRRWGDYRDVFRRNPGCVGVLMSRAGALDPLKVVALVARFSY